MSRRVAEPQEAIGPVVDGLQNWPLPLPVQEPEPVEPDPEPAPVAPEETVLICGNDERAQAVEKLARDCGFVVQNVQIGQPPEFLDSSDTIYLENLDNFVEDCAVGRDHFICIFLEDPEESEKILRQCLASEAFYLGAWANAAQRQAIFAKLKEDGAPDAELAAICCPMGLSLDTSSPQQDAVAIVAEILAARAGVLKRLRYGA